MQTKQTYEQLLEQFAACPAERNGYVIDGKEYTVIRHFTGERNIDEVIYELAVSRAKREMGL